MSGWGLALGPQACIDTPWAQSCNKVEDQVENCATWPKPTPGSNSGLLGSVICLDVRVHSEATLESSIVESQAMDWHSTRTSVHSQARTASLQVSSVAQGTSHVGSLLSPQTGVVSRVRSAAEDRAHLKGLSLCRKRMPRTLRWPGATSQKPISPLLRTPAGAKNRAYLRDRVRVQGC